MTAFAGIDHLGLSVTDLDVSERFYTGVLGFDRLVDFGEVRVLIDRPSSFTLSLSRHAGARPGPFSELTTGLDHIGLTAGSRDELVEWEDRFRAAGVASRRSGTCRSGTTSTSAIPTASRSEFFVPNDVLNDEPAGGAGARVPEEEIRARVEQVLAGDLREADGRRGSLGACGRGRARARREPRRPVGAPDRAAAPAGADDGRPRPARRLSTGTRGCAGTSPTARARTRRRARNWPGPSTSTTPGTATGSGR